MNNKPMVRFAWLMLLPLLIVTSSAMGQSVPTTPPSSGKVPIIVIPGLTGSELINRKTGAEVWFKPRRAKDDDIRLPITPNIAANRDNLVPRDIIRSVKLFKLLPETEIYERLIDALSTRWGYREAKWTTASKQDAADTFFLFPYDWRRDNVENARLLVRRIETLKRRLGKPGLKFNVISHSMGGLIARYAAMYGNTELPAANPRPTWIGARHFDKIFLVGTPNQGSVEALSSFLEGASFLGGGINIPFIRDIDRFDVFTIPSVYQLLPHEGTLLAYDENFQAITIDHFNPEEWEKYDWAIWQDGGFDKKFSAEERRNARAFFRSALLRAKLFQSALNAASSGPTSVSFYLVGADCKETSAGVMLIKDTEKNRWKTHFKAGDFTRTNGEKVKKEQIKPLLFADGDGVVTKASLALAGAQQNGRQTALPVSDVLYQCVDHNKLLTSEIVQEKLFAFLNPQNSAP